LAEDTVMQPNRDPSCELQHQRDSRRPAVSARRRWTDVVRRAAGWMMMLAGAVVSGGTATVSAADPIPLFNGTSLDGWDGERQLWHVVDGSIAGISPGLSENHFLVHKDAFSDFELTFEVRLHDPTANAGVQFRSQRIPGTTEMIGYQADIGSGVWGGLYDESRRRQFLARPAEEFMSKTVQEREWNHYRVRAVGPRIQLFLNDVLMVDYTETDAAIPQRGLIGLQVHSGRGFRIEYRGLSLRPLTAP
jgi:hypothetical protein